MKSIEHYEQLAREAKRESCKHENADHLTEGEAVEWEGPLFDYVATCEQLRCVDCAAWLSLGPSNDRGRKLRVEIAAARLNAGYESANDTADDLADPIVRRAIACMLGETSRISKDAREAFELHDVTTDDLRGDDIPPGGAIGELGEMECFEDGAP